MPDSADANSSKSNSLTYEQACELARPALAEARRVSQREIVFHLGPDDGLKDDRGYLLSYSIRGIEESELGSPDAFVDYDGTVHISAIIAEYERYQAMTPVHA